MSEVLIVGAGPGGCSCALWLAQQGIACTVLEQAPAPLHTLRELDLPQSWVLGHPHTSTQALAELYTRHIEAEPLVQLRRNVTLAQVEHLSATRKAFVLSDGTRLESRALDLVAEAFEAIALEGPAERRGGRDIDRRRLARVVDFIEAHLDQPLDLTSLAREGALSINTLQRLFRAAFHRTDSPEEA